MQNGIFLNSEPGKGMGYTEHEKQVKNALIDHKDYNCKTLYLFFMSGKTAFTAKGYMPFNKKFGFIYRDKQEIQELIRTIAHELGHGAFRLRHPSSPECPYPQPEGQTHNLMDYVDAGKALQALALHKYQWDEVHDRDLGLNLFEDAGEGAAPVLSVTYADKVYRFIETFRCSYLKKSSFDFFSFHKKPEEAIPIVNLNNTDFAVEVSIKKSITSFTPIKVQPIDISGGKKLYKFSENVSISVSGDIALFENYLFPVNISSNSSGVRTLVALNRIDDACKLIFKNSQCMLEDIPYKDIWKIMESLSKETYLEDYKDYSLLELLKIVASDQEMSISLYTEFTKNENLVLSLYQGIDDENTKETFISLLLKIHSNYYTGKTISVPKEKHYVSWTECQRNGTRINIRVLDYYKGHYIQSQVFNLLEPVAYVLPGKRLNENDIVFYPPALFILYQFETTSAQNIKEFLTGAVQLVGVFSSAGILLKGAGIIQKSIAAAEIANAAINLTLQSKAVQDKIKALEGGNEFLQKWPTISTLVDVISIGNAVSSLFIKGGRNTLKELDNTLSDIEKTRIKNVLDECERVVAKTGNVIDDAILDAAKAFDDNILDVADVGFQNWKTFQNRVALQSKIRYPNSKIGNQITLDITYVKNGQTYTKTIIPDNLVQIEVNGVKKYKLIDAKTSVKNDLTQINDLTGTCTQNQQPIYKIIDGESGAGTITKVEMRGGQAEQAFGISSKTEIQLELGVEFWVNSSKTDFTQYLIRSRIK